MARKAGDINAKIAYLTNPKTGPILKVKRPLFLRDTPYFSKKQSRNATSCQDQASTFFDCLKMNDYHEGNCAQQLKALIACQSAIEANMPKKRSAKDKRLNKPKPQQQTADSQVKATRLYTVFPNPIDQKSKIIQHNIYKTSFQQLTKLAPYKDRGQLEAEKRSNKKNS